jgi:hypothetical protein
MTLEEKQVALNALREAFCAFINVITNIECAIPQRNQAVIRLDEGHMWMQNAIMTYTKAAPESVIEPEQPVVNIPIEQTDVSNQ